MFNIQHSRCALCNHQLLSTSYQFYCCNRNQRYCILCRDKKCIKCNKIIDKRYQQPKCKICYTRFEDDQVLEPICQSYYCSKCLVTRIIKRNTRTSTIPSQNQKYYLMTCGHQIQKTIIDNFILQKFCKICGRKYNSTSDYQLVDGGKCCFECIRWQKKQVESLIYQCMVCGKLMKKKTEVASNVHDGVILCFGCAKESCMEEQRCQIQREFKKVQEKKQVDNYMENVVGGYGEAYKQTRDKQGQAYGQVQGSHVQQSTQPLQIPPPQQHQQQQQKPPRQQHNSPIKQPPLPPKSPKSPQSPKIQTYSIIVTKPKQQQPQVQQPQSKSPLKHPQSSLSPLKPSQSNKSPIKSQHKSRSPHRHHRHHHHRDGEKSPGSKEKRSRDEKKTDESLNNNKNQSQSQSKEKPKVSFTYDNNKQQDKLFKVFQQPKKSLAEFQQVQSVLQIQNTASNEPPKKPSQSQSQSQSSPSSSTHPTQTSTAITILQSFPSQKEQLTSPYPKRTIKKHLSITTLIQNMKIQIESQEPNIKIVTCKQCDYDLEVGQAFTIQNSLHQVGFYCRLCYTIVTNKGLLGFNVVGGGKLDKSRNMRGLSNQRHKVLTNLIFSSPGEKQNQFGTPVKNPNLTNTYNVYNPTSTFPTSTFPTSTTQPQPQPQQSQNTPPQPQKQPSSLLPPSKTHEKMSVTVRTNDNRHLYKEQCAICKKSGVSVIRTADQGSLCFGCYYTRRK